MPRGARIAPGKIVYHVLNRANARSELFHKREDYSAFERIMISAQQPKGRRGELYGRVSFRMDGHETHLRGR